eukprot:10782932-Karenia_brevis.AAC.1
MQTSSDQGPGHHVAATVPRDVHEKVYMPYDADFNLSVLHVLADKELGRLCAVSIAHLNIVFPHHSFFYDPAFSEKHLKPP